MRTEIVKIGDKKSIKVVVKPSDAAAFNDEIVHPVYSTFALGRDAEWACRQFVLEMKEIDEEGIGTFLNIKHHSPALIGEEVTIEATAINITSNGIDCSYEVKVNDRLIATGTQGQKVLKKEKIDKLFNSIEQ